MCDLRYVATQSMQPSGGSSGSQPETTMPMSDPSFQEAK
jgi:hypothetical protein